MRLALLDTELERMHSVNLRLWIGVIMVFVALTTFTVSWAAWIVVRRDYVNFNAITAEALAQRDRLMDICVMRDNATKAQVKQVKAKLNIGGEEK